MATLPDHELPFDIQEQRARIDKIQAELQKLLVDTIKVKQDTRLAPWTVGFAGVGTGAALLGAGIGIAKLLTS